MMKKILTFILLTIPFLTVSIQDTHAYEIDYSSYWSCVEVVTNTWTCGFTFDIDESINSIDITITDLGYNYNTVGAFDSYLKLYDDLGLVDDIDLDELITFDPTDYSFEGTINIDLNTLFIDGSEGDYEIDSTNYPEYQIDYITLTVMQTFTSLPTNYEFSFTDANPVVLDRTYALIKYFSLVDIGGGTTQLQLYETQQVYTLFPETITDPDDLTTTNIFEYWVYRNIDDEWIKYDYTEPINDNMYSNGREYIMMMAVFTDFVGDYELTYSTTENTPTGFDAFLSVVGMDNTAGYVLLYSLLNLIIVIIIAIKKYNPVYLAVLSIFVTSLFVYFNILPVYITVIIVMLYIVFFASQRGIGGSTE